MYENLLDGKSLWNVYNPNAKFVKRSELRKLLSKNYKVCPYCDLVDMNESTSSNMDHFLPLSEFPFLSVFGGILSVLVPYVMDIKLKTIIGLFQFYIHTLIAYTTTQGLFLTKLIKAYKLNR